MVVTSSSNLIKSEEIVGKSNEKPLLYEGTTVITDPKNPLVLPILHAESTAYSYKPDLPVKDVSLIKLKYELSTILNHSILPVFSSIHWEQAKIYY